MSMMVSPYQFAAAGGGGGGGTDPNFSSVKLLIGADTSVVDESGSPHTLTAVNQAARTTAVKKFGAGALVFDGTGDEFNTPDSADWAFGSGDFTIELWFNANSIAANQTLIAQYAAAPNRGWQLIHNAGATPDLLQFAISTTGSNNSNLLSIAWAPTPGTWHHVCAERSGSAWRLYADGVMLQNVTSTSVIFDSAASLTIGQAQGINSVNGYLDEIRITKGVARYASDAGYTVPTAAFPRS